jgi:hypothetical protein
LMSQLGTRLLFYEVPAIAPTDDELVAYAKKDQADTAEGECQKAVTEFLVEFFRIHPVASVPPDSIVFSNAQLEEIVRWARFLVCASGGRRLDRNCGMT